MLYPVGLLDSDHILGVLSADKDIARARFKEFNEDESIDKCMDEELSLRITDEEARRKISKQLNGIGLAQVKSLPKVERDKVFRKVKEIEGITQRQAARIFGVSSNLIFKA